MTPHAASGRPRPRGGRARLAAGLAALLVAMAAMVTGCTAVSDTAPGCGQQLRLAIVAQSLPSASYLPCTRPLPQGWSTSGFRAAPGGTSFLLNSDRSPGHPVRVQLSPACRPGDASPSPPRAPGAVTYTRLTSITPRFAGSLYDVFPGGCVSYSFDFTLGSQISLMEQFEQAVGLYPRQQLRLVLKRRLGVELGP